MTRKVIIDCDPGHDDALAILLAARHFDVLGVTTVHGNQSLSKVTENALKVLEFSGLTDIPVFSGAERPIVQRAQHAPEVHGESGLDGPPLPRPKLSAKAEHAVDFIVRTVMSEDEVALAATGPLTNVALALHREPRLGERLREISLMGGSLTFGNSTPAAEFNIWCDPEAAHIVFASGVPTKMVGLNLTRHAEAGPGETERIRNLGNRTGQIVAELLEFYGGQVRKLFGLAGASLHDPCAVAWLIDPTLIEARMLHVAVELQGENTRGMTVCDYRHLKSAGAEIGGVEGIRRGSAPNAEVGLRLDVERFFNLLIGDLARYP
jgi:inosine-uridine nucleoside N-ribohydrolase